MALAATIRIQQADFDVAQEIAALSKGRTDIGAVVSFSGICRGTEGSEPIAALTLEHYPDMAEAEIKRYYFTEQAVKGEPTGMVCGGMAEVFIEVLAASPVLLVCGGGPVGQAVAQAGRVAGFELVVTDDRSEFLRPELFPAGVATEPVSRDFREDFLARWRERDLYVATVSRCWETDAAAIAGVLRQAPPRLRYLGLMGSRRKVERVRREVAAQGLQIDDAVFHAPIGIAIGGTSPGEIAISILAQMTEVLRRGEKGGAG